MNKPEFHNTTLKLRTRLVERIDACAHEEGISRAEWMRSALIEAANRSEERAIRRAEWLRTDAKGGETT